MECGTRQGASGVDGSERQMRGRDRQHVWEVVIVVVLKCEGDERDLE